VGTIESGNYNKVPIILGSNTDEVKFFLPLLGGMVHNNRWAQTNPMGCLETTPNISMGTGEYTSTDVQNLFQSPYMSLPEATRNIMFWFNFWPDS
jgi:hypothetical protein